MIIEKLTLFKDCGCASKKKSIGLTDISFRNNTDFGTEITKIGLGGGGGTNKETGSPTVNWTCTPQTCGYWTQDANDLPRETVPFVGGALA